MNILHPWLRTARSCVLLLSSLAIGTGSNGCMSLRSVEASAVVVDTNGIVAHHSPSFDNSVTWFGWTAIAATTIGGGYAGYASDAALRWDGWERPERTISAGNAAIGAVAGFWSSLCLTYLIGGSAPAVTSDNADLWVRKLDDELLLVRGGTQPSSSMIRTIPRDADARFDIRSIADAEIFRHTFENSPHTERVVGEALGVLARRDLPRLAELFSESPITRAVQARYVDGSDSLEEAIALAKRYPAVADVAERAAARRVRTIEAVQRYREAFPNATSDSIALAMAGSIERRELPRLAEVFTGNAVVGEIARIYVEMSATVDEATEAAARYPSMATLAEERAAGMVASVAEAQRFAAAFPSSAHRGSIAARLADSLHRDEIPDYLTLFPETDRAPALRRRYVMEATSVREVVAAAKLFPEQAAQAEVRAAAIARSITDYRAYVAGFPTGSRAKEMTAAIEEDLRTVVNLGPNINSEVAEISPVISPDGRTLYFDRKYHGDNTGGYSDPDEIWYAELGENGEWQAAKQIGAPINRSGPDHMGSVTPDGNTLLLGISYDGSRGFSLTHRTADGWSYPQTIEIDDYYNVNTYLGGNFLANDGTTLIVSIERLDTRGGRDLYVSFRRDDGSWTAPRNLGSTLNTRQDEDTPFLAADGRTLYFASSGHAGYGGDDILMTRRLDDSWTKWSKPVNLGPTINTPDEENDFFIPASGEHAFFTTTNDGYGSADIVRIGVPKHARPQPVVLLSGRILDRATNQPLEAKIYYETLADGKKIGEARSDPRTGAYKITLPAGAVYGFRAEADGFVAIAENLDLTSLGFYSEQTRDLFLVPMEAGQTIRMNNLFFDVGKASLRRESIPELERLAGLLRRNTAMTIEITGHTDDVGTEENNLALSQNRADAVRSFILGKGVPADRVTAVGKGETMPVESNISEAGRQRNRRVEFTIVSK